MTAVVIKVNGSDITDDVIIKDASFTTSVGSYPGEFDIKVKDPDKVYDFKASDNITLDLDGTRSFDGYVLQASKSFAFPVVRTSEDPALMWHLRGPDINILFKKRFVFKQSDPAARPSDFPTGSTDLTQLNMLISDWIDLSDDNLTTDFHHVGSPNPDLPGLPFTIGDDWQRVMSLISSLPGAVWGIRPDRTIYYEDDDTESAPFRLSDVPNNATTFGYSDLEWLNDGTKLANDAPVWGAGVGSARLVYARAEDATSIANHGRWQYPGQLRFDVFRQTTVTAISNSIVYGSPQNLHGGKDDALLVTCRVKRPGLTPGDKVYIESQVFGISKVLPIRRMMMTFPTPTDVLYDLQLSYEIDRPLSYHEFLLPPKSVPPLPPPPPPPPPCLETAETGSWNILPGPLWGTSYDRGVLNPETTVAITTSGGGVDWVADVRAGTSGTIQGVEVEAVLDFFGQAVTTSQNEWVTGLTIQCPTLEFGGARDPADFLGAGFSQVGGDQTRFEVSSVTIGPVTFEARRRGYRGPSIFNWPNDYLDLFIIYGATTYALGTVDAALEFDSSTTTWRPRFGGPTIDLSVAVSALAGVTSWNVVAHDGLGETSTFAGSAIYGGGGRPDVIYQMNIQGNNTGPASGVWSGSIQLGQILWNDLPNCSLRGIPVTSATESGATFCESPTSSDSTNYRTTYDFLPGSLELYLSGTRQRNNIDYYESPTIHDQFSFAHPPTATETVYCCYSTYGSGSGGGRVVAK